MRRERAQEAIAANKAVAPPAFAPRLPAQVVAGGVRDWEVEQYRSVGGLVPQTVSGMNVNYLDAPAGTMNYSGAQITSLTNVTAGR